MANAQVVHCGCPEKPVVTYEKTVVRSFNRLKPGTRMSVSEFTAWLDRLDGNNDGVISRSELEKALKGLGLWFTSWKAKQAMAFADTNDNGLIDTDEEFKQLIEYAQKNWGLIIYED